MRDVAKSFALRGACIGAIFGVAALMARRYNEYCNNQHLSHPGYAVVSSARGICGHTEYSRYEDGSQDVKVYFGLGHDLFDSLFYQDINGDGKVDRIRRESGKIKMNRLEELLMRTYDYQQHKKDFDEADRVLRGQMQKYQNKAEEEK